MEEEKRREPKIAGEEVPSTDAMRKVMVFVVFTFGIYFQLVCLAEDKKIDFSRIYTAKLEVLSLIHI